MRFAQSHVTGHHAVLKTAQNVVTVERHREQVLLPVAQAPYVDAGCFQIVDEHARAWHHAGQRIDEIVQIVPHHIGPLVSVAFTHQSHAIVIGHAGVQFVVDVVEAGNVIVEELFHQSVRVPWGHHRRRIPIDKHVAEIEDHVGDLPAGVRSGVAVGHKHVIFHLRLSRPAFHAFLHS